MAYLSKLMLLNIFATGLCLFSWTNLVMSGTIYAQISTPMYKLHQMTRVWGMYMYILTFDNHIEAIIPIICTKPDLTACL